MHVSHTVGWRMKGILQNATLSVKSKRAFCQLQKRKKVAWRTHRTCHSLYMSFKTIRICLSLHGTAPRTSHGKNNKITVRKQHLCHHPSVVLKFLSDGVSVSYEMQARASQGPARSSAQLPGALEWLYISQLYLRWIQPMKKYFFNLKAQRRYVIPPSAVSEPMVFKMLSKDMFRW